MPLRSEYLLEKSMVDKLDDLLKLADGVARQVWGAASTLASYLVAPEQDSKAENARSASTDDVTRLTTSWGIERAYWSQLETPFRTVLMTLPDDPDQAANDWKTILRRAAWSAFDTVGDNLDPSPRTLKAVVFARGQLAGGLAKTFPE